MFSRLRLLTAGESHGPKLTAILEGAPAGFAINTKTINADLARRQQGFGRGGRMKIERDEVHISSGVAQGLTTGAPIAMEITNADYKSWQDKAIEPMTTPRPGHADLTGALKYGHRDLRLSLERASARETTMRVCAGSLCKQILEPFGLTIGGYVTQIGPIKIKLNELSDRADFVKRFDIARANEFAIPDESFEDSVREEIHRCMKDKDTLGGIFEIVALGVPVGLGTYAHWDRRLDGQIAMAMLSIPAMKGMELGHAFRNAEQRGTKVHDEIFIDKDGSLFRKTNRGAGLEGGISNGMPIVARIAMKPISTTLNPLDSVDMAKGKASKTTYERSDFCAVPRAVPIGEAMMAYVLANALLEKLGGDSYDEMVPRFEMLRQNRLSDVHLTNQPWRFQYEQI